MTGLQQADRREFGRYRSAIAVELETQAGEIVPCTLADISSAGASVLCGPIAESAVVRLRLEGFGEIKTSRLRAADGFERLLFRDGEFRICQLNRFLALLIDAGAALPVLHRRRQGCPAPESAAETLLATADDAFIFRVNQAINLVVQAHGLDGNLPDNIVPFPSRQNSPADPPPDRIA